ncbi:MAG: hypothetical protein JWM76_818 [Pseudonocardiales bacterium]|nr:hypothetical protein [Pseudonocardiales bacterium]
MNRTKVAGGLLKGWTQDPDYRPNQLTHAVEEGRTVAICGVHTAVVSDPWPDLGSGIPMCRCQTCAKAVYLIEGRESIF